ncbi:MAG: response regulator transcription factor [Sphingomonas sp.]|jgi:two-component system OmpR family response regulator|uniref:response regulator transcription factor n=1 Tax=Sphingomonas sp. TaxID=28214 RepID=UPI00356B505C
MRLLLIEDDQRMAETVAAALAESGHQVDIVGDGAEGFDRALNGRYDVVVIDRMLPGMDGLAVVAGLRDRDIKVPVLLLTALGSVSDRVAGLRGGADDYLVKPFSMVELEARVEALGRRSSGLSDALLTVGTLALDRMQRRVWRGDKLVHLQPREYQLLEMLMQNAPAVVTRMMLLEQIWRFRFDPGTNLVESHVSRLRTKIDRGGDPPLIHTIKGEGYAVRAG